MNENYLSEVIKSKIGIEETEEKTIYEKGNLPMLKKYGTMLTPLKEMIVKFTYLTGGFYKSDFKLLFAFSYDGQTIDKNLKKLEKDGYLKSEDTRFGKLYGLSKAGIEQIRCNPKYFSGDRKSVNLQDMKLDGETAYQKRKLLSYNVASHVFRTQLVELYNKYATTDRIERNIRLAKIYLKNIRYRDFLKSDRQERMGELLLMDFSSDEADSMTKNDSYIPKYAEQYAEKAFSYLGFDNLRQEQQYRDYIAYIKKECICKEPDYNTFYLLRDFQDTYDYKELDIIKDWKCNLVKFGISRLWNGVKDNDLILYMKQLEQCNRLLGILGNEERSLTATNAYKKKTDEEELKLIMAKLSILDKRTGEIKEIKDRLETDFSFPVITSYFDGGTESELKVITITRLMQNGIYLEADSESHINIRIIQQQEEADLFSLHRKIGMSFQLARRLFPLCHFDILIYAYDDEQTEAIRAIIPRIADRLKNSRETSFIGNLLADNHKIISGKSRLEERYKFFNQMYDFLNQPKFSIDCPTTNY